MQEDRADTRSAHVPRWSLMLRTKSSRPGRVGWVMIGEERPTVGLSRKGGDLRDGSS
jgi:hypothetical protein